MGLQSLFESGRFAELGKVDAVVSISPPGSCKRKITVTRRRHDVT